MATATEPELITYRQALARAGFSMRTLIDRIKDERLTVYIDGQDRRRRLLDAREVDQLIEARPRPERVA